MQEINQKIKSFAVKQADDATSGEAVNGPAPSSAQGQVMAELTAPRQTEMNESIGRPEVLMGATYKIAKSPSSEHALYITINDILLDAGTPFERRRPFEIFINSKNMDQFQWIVAMTRIMSAVFRKGGDVTFLVDEMKAVFDPHGGYFRPGGGYVPSLIAEIGAIVEKHLISLGMIEIPEMDDATKALIEEKRKQAMGLSKATSAAAGASDSNLGAGGQPAPDANEGSFPPNATMCKKCHQKSVVIMDGCATCLNCGNSKCG